MKKIKLTSPFSKLFTRGSLVDAAKLIQVLEIDLSEITQEMRDYDTDYGKYPLPAKGKYLLLIFLKPAGGGIFTTLCRSTPEKLRWYTEGVGQVFELSVSHEKVQA